MHSVALKILNFWFEESKSIQWFKKDIEYDNLIKKKFIKDHNAAIKGDYKNWKESPYESLAFIILLDQFSRNIYRNDPRSFKFDPISLDFCKNGLNKLFESKLKTNDQKLFFILPLIHCENIKEQNLAIKILDNQFKNTSKYKEISKFFRRHQEIIKRFGRFPHRNSILIRESTKEEIEFLKTPFSSF